MGFLNPLLLVLGLGIAVPLVLHLLRHGDRVRIVFPAFRYLHRTEREHARRIRTRQILLLLLRCAVVLLAAFAASRPFLRRGNDSHRPTAVAIVVDNSLTSGRVVGERRMLDTLVAAAGAVIDRAGPDDRFWVLRAAEPWRLSLPGPAASARALLADIEPTDGAADLISAVGRARDIVRGAGLAGAEVHLLTDGQASGFMDRTDEAARFGDDDAPPVLVFAPVLPEAPNRSVGDVLVNEGLVPLIGEPIRISAAVRGEAVEGGETVAARLLVQGEVRSVVRVRPPGTALFELSAAPAAARISGVVELDPDALRADDRAYFSIDLRAPPTVRPPPGSPFLAAALGVLADAGRILLGGLDSEIVFLEGGDALPDSPTGRVLFVAPPSDPTLLPAVNRRLEQLGIGWRMSSPLAVPGSVVTFSPPIVGRDSVRVFERYPLQESAGGARGTPFARTPDGAPWAISGALGADRWVLFGSPIEPEATTLPLTATLYEVLDWVLSGAGASTGRTGVSAGSPLGTPPTTTAIRTPEGAEVPVGGARAFAATGRAGIYQLLAGDTVLSSVAVSPPARESELARLDTEDLEARLGGTVRSFDDLGPWARGTYLARRGRELGAWLLVLLLVALAAESLLASAGGQARTATSDRRTSPGYAADPSGAS